MVIDMNQVLAYIKAEVKPNLLKVNMIKGRLFDVYQKWK